MSSALPTQIDLTGDLAGAVTQAPLSQVPMSQVIISFAEDLIALPNFGELEALYQQDKIVAILQQVLQYFENHQDTIEIPSQMGEFIFQKTVELEIYVTEPVEARAINLDARGKDYATNILSYASELPEAVLELLPALPLGELVICHAVVVSQAAEQGKTVAQHLTHLLVHGMLHLLGFDHELGQAEQDEMEAIEIAVLDKLSVANPYE
ncbi:Endoribonuclease YbeY [Enhydrobacter sp. 8BJ]|nr:rRNA maturation RNase YbeY [Enhydrobacter sp. 8BJ]VXB67253.1 Endoribonuclease YbeY [Enhydrobacter sp. 8BJ]